MKTKNIIITGTSRGIGFELVKLFANHGHQVLALSRNLNPISELQIKNVFTISCDVCEISDYKKVEEFINTNWKQVDVLINNAGTLINKPFVETTMADF